MNQFKITIIIPVYNCRWEWLKGCLDSITAQLHESVEVIVLDDASSDTASALECERYVANWKQVTFSRNDKNRGVSYTRNRGMELSRGEYLWFVDADDWIEPEAITLLLRVLENEKPDTVFFEYSRCWRDHSVPEHRSICPEACTYFSREMAKRMILSNDFNSPCTILFSREILKQNGLRFDETMKLGEDFCFNYHYLCQFRKGSYIARSLYNYRQNEGSATHTFSTEKVRDTGVGYWIRRNLLSEYFSDQEKNRLEAEMTDTYYRALRAHILNGIVQKMPRDQVMTCFEQEWVKELLQKQPHALDLIVLRRLLVSGSYSAMWLLAQVKKTKNVWKKRE